MTERYRFPRLFGLHHRISCSLMGWSRWRRRIYARHTRDVGAKCNHDSRVALTMSLISAEPPDSMKAFSVCLVLSWLSVLFSVLMWMNVFCEITPFKSAIQTIKLMIINHPLITLPTVIFLMVKTEENPSPREWSCMTHGFDRQTWTKIRFRSFQGDQRGKSERS